MILWTALKGLMAYHRAEKLAFRCEFEKANEAISSAVDLLESVSHKAKVPAEVYILCAMLRYRVGLIDDSYNFVRKSIERIELPKSKLSPHDITYIRFYLAELLEHLAGISNELQSDQFLNYADTIGPSIKELELSKVSWKLKNLYPLVLP